MRECSFKNPTIPFVMPISGIADFSQMEKIAQMHNITTKKFKITQKKKKRSVLQRLKISALRKIKFKSFSYIFLAKILFSFLNYT